MKIAIIQPVIPRYDISFFNELAKQAPHLDFIVLADIETKDSLNQVADTQVNFKYAHLPLVERRGFWWRPQLMKRLRELEPDLVIFNGNPRDMSQVLAMARMRLAGKRFAVWGMFHRVGGMRPVSKAYYKLCGKLADRCMTYTEIGARTLLNIGVPKAKVRVVGTAIDQRVPMAHAAALTPERKREFAAQQGLLGKKAVLQVVRLTRPKQPHLLIEAARLLADKRDDVVFVLIGGGDMQGELEQMAKRYGLEGRVRFVGPLYDEAQLALWYGISDVFVLPTNIGLSAHHALSYGMPIVTDNSLDGQASESVTLSNGLNAILYEEGDVGSMAEAIDAILSDPERAALMSRNAQLAVSTVHNLERKVAGFLRALPASRN